MDKLYLCLFSLFFITNSVYGQLPDWSTAPDFSLPDLNDNYHDLYDYLDDGYSVVLDFSATWCGPCWNYHQMGTLEDIYDEFGPGGEDKVMVFMIEADPGTSQQCIYGPSGCSGGSIGDWTAGVSYPILNPGPAEAFQVNNDFNINYYPTLYGIAPNGDVLEIGQAPFDVWEHWVAESFQMHNTSWDTNEGDCTESFIDLHPVGGHGSISYQWSNGATTEDLFDIPSGDYYLTMTDDQDYEVELGPIFVSNNNGAEIQLVEIGHIDCPGGSEGFIDVEVSGGVDDFEYYWSNGSNDEDLEDVPGGEYTLVAYDTGSGCEFEHVFEIWEPEEIEYELDIEPAPCHGNQLGSVEFYVDGGSWPITFFFDNFDTQEEYVELEPGEYTVTIMDYNGCELITETFEIESLDAPVADAAFAGMLNCETDSIALTIDSSSYGPHISYAWYNEHDSLLGADTILYIHEAGNYYLQVINNNSLCEALDSVQVINNLEMVSAEIDIVQPLDCSHAEAILQATVDTPDSLFSIHWSSASGEILSDPASLNVIVGTPAIYELEITHTTSGCSSIVPVSVTEAALPELSVTGEFQFCPGSMAEICIDYNASERLEWTIDGQHYTDADQQECILINEEGIIQLSLTDLETDCQVSENIFIEELPEPAVELVGDTELCSGYESELCVVTNASSVYWYRDNQLISREECIVIAESNDYFVKAENQDNGCSTSLSFTTQVHQLPQAVIQGNAPLCPGQELELCSELTHLNTQWLINGEAIASNASCIMLGQTAEVELIVSDPVTGCSASSSIETLEGTAPEVLALTASNPLSCSLPSSTLSLELSTGFSSIEWYGPFDTLLEMNTTELIVSAPGRYSVLIYSSDGCITGQEITLDASEDDIPEAEFNHIRNGLSVTFENLSTGENLDYSWDFGDGTFSSERNPVHTYQNAGVYHVSLLVENICGKASASYSVSAYEELKLAIVTSNISCYGAEDGRIKVNAFDGLPEYSFEWELEGQNIQAGSELQNMGPGLYAFTITDQAGQLISDQVLLTEPEPLEVEAEITSSALDEESGAIDLSVYGGNGSYRFLWNNGQTTEDISQLPQGIYSVTVTDAKQCQITESFEISGTTSVAGAAQFKSFHIYPNPATEQVYLECEFNRPSEFSLKFLDMTGRVVISKNGNSKELDLRLNITELKSGVYIIVLETGPYQIIEKLMVVR